MENTIIGGLIGIAGTLVGVLGTYLLQWLNEQRKLREEYTYLKNKAFHWSYINDVNARLLPIKDFFLRHPRFLKRAENERFFQEWLTDHNVDIGKSGMNTDRLQQMRAALSKTEV